jgi:hypothetical protein
MAVHIVNYIGINLPPQSPAGCFFGITCHFFPKLEEKFSMDHLDNIYLKNLYLKIKLFQLKI